MDVEVKDAWVLYTGCDDALKRCRDLGCFGLGVAFAVPVVPALYLHVGARIQGRNIRINWILLV